MSHAKIISIIDHEITRSRVAVLTDLTNVASSIAQELTIIGERLDALQAEVTRLRQQGGGSPPVK
jgi:hypothetical protein